MKRLTFIVYFLSAIIFIYGYTVRIFKGSDAPEGAHPYHAYLTAVRRVQGEPSGTYCGGSIIHKRWILTAAHCFLRYDFRSIRVEVGSLSRTKRIGIIYKVENYLVHEAFNQVNFENDIALLRVHEDILFNDKVQPIRLADGDTKIGDDEAVRFTGFGRIEDHTRPEGLQTVVLKMFGYRVCKRVERRIIETQICTLPIQGKGPCIGDSGGALVNSNGIQVGIYSHSYGNMPLSCGQIPEIYTQVSSFRDWIDDKIKQYQ